ncbi:MAG: PAS domain S-box protein [Acidobacteria bacterium]|nr:PAS domain S-box protein [Acidobacteriota bacterium]
MALGGLAVAILLRWLVDPLLGDTVPFITLFGAVAAAVWLGGWRPAALVTVLGYAACAYLFIPPRGTLFHWSLPGAVSFAAFVFTCALIIVFGQAMRLAQSRTSERRELLQVTLRSIGDAVITTDVEGRIASLNPVAESLTGWSQREALGRPLDDVFRIVHEETRRPVPSPAARALAEGAIVGLANHTVLLARDGSERSIDDSAAPIKDESGRVSGCVLVFRDISVRRRVERARVGQLLSDRLLASIVESSDDAIVSKSLEGIVESWNAAAVRLFGYEPGEAVGRHISLVIPPERLSEEDDIIASLKAGKSVEHFETVRLRKDGRRILVSLTVSPVKDETGRVVGASKIVRDVTRQREAEERERQLLADAAAANAKFHAFFEQGALFAGIMEVDGTLLDANRLSWEGCGFTREQATGMKFWDGPWFSPSPALVDEIRAASALAASGQTFRKEVPYFVGDGSERVADVTIQPIRDGSGKVLFLAPTGADVTDRKRAESDREKFVALVETSTDFIGMCDLQGVPFFVNRAGLRLVGLDDLEAARRTPVQEFFFPEDQSRVLNQFFPSVLERGHGEIEVRFRHFVTGDALWMAYKVLTLTDGRGAPVAFATVSQDVTRRKKLEEDLRVLAADLSEAGRRKDEFLAMLAHELRNPLAPMSNAVHVLKRAGGGDTAHAATSMLERQVAQMSRLVDDLLDMSRITQGKIELRRERLELSPLLTQAVDAATPLYLGMGHELTLTVPQRPLIVNADGTRLAQVVGNLLNNAAKFTDRGGLVTVTAERDGADAVLRVHDSGIGISPEELPRVFDMFTQVDTSLERSRGGLGIGLTLVRRLVEMHGGSVFATSPGLGRGSEFVVRLPLASELPETQSTSPPGDAPAPRRRVLIVDDNKDGAESLAMLLTLEGHETHTAHDGLAALEAAERLRPEIVLLDIGLPLLNGYEVCQRLREQTWGKAMKLVALTGWGQEDDRRKSSKAGFDHHLVKPVDHVALARLIAGSK